MHLPLAGPTSRILAYAVDLVLVYLLEIGAIALLLLGSPIAGWLLERLGEIGDAARSGSPQELLESGAFLYLFAFFVVLQLALEWGYFIFFELTTGGRSPGKALLGLRVLRDGGEPVDLRASLMRNLLRAVDALPVNYVVGLVAMVLSPEGKRLGDLAAGTVVARLDRPARARRVDDGDPADALRFRFDRAQIARLGRAERALLRQTLRRVTELEPEAASAALARATEVLCHRIDYPAVAESERQAFLRALQRAAR